MCWRLDGAICRDPGRKYFTSEVMLFQLSSDTFGFCYSEGSSGFRHYHIKETMTSPKKYYLAKKHAFGSIPEILNIISTMQQVSELLKPISNMVRIQIWLDIVMSSSLSNFIL